MDNKTNKFDIERHIKIAAMYNTGCISMTDIGKQLNVSRERIRQIINRNRKIGIETISFKKWKELNRKFSIRKNRELSSALN